MFKSQIRPITTQICDLYLKYFGCEVADQDKPWAPHTVCMTCVKNLTDWDKTNGAKQMPFATPMYWMEIQDHSKCYFCLTNVAGFNKTNKNKIVYPEKSSATKPQPFQKHEKRPKPGSAESTPKASSTSSQETSASQSFEDNNSPKLFTQPKLNDFVRNMNLSKQRAELCGQNLKDMNLLGPECFFAWYRDREADFRDFFVTESLVTFCVDIE